MGIGMDHVGWIPVLGASSKERVHERKEVVACDRAVAVEVRAWLIGEERGVVVEEILAADRLVAVEIRAAADQDLRDLVRPAVVAVGALLDRPEMTRGFGVNGGRAVVSPSAVADAPDS